MCEISLTPAFDLDNEKLILVKLTRGAGEDDAGSALVLVYRGTVEALSQQLRIRKYTRRRFVPALAETCNAQKIRNREPKQSKVVLSHLFSSKNSA